jgi:hypothetical protein
MSLRTRHDREDRLALLRTKKNTLDTIADHTDLDATIRGLWPGWTSVETGLSADTDKDMVWVFTHPERGWWAAMFVPEASNRWKSSPTDNYSHRRNTIGMAVDYSGSGADLIEVCEALLSQRRWELSWNTQAVARLATLPALGSVLREHNVEFMLALSGLSTHVPATAEYHGYGTPFRY